MMSSIPGSSGKHFPEAGRPIGRKRTKRQISDGEGRKKVEIHIASISRNMGGQYRELETYNRLMALSMPGGDAKSKWALEMIRKRMVKEIEEEENDVPDEEVQECQREVEDS